MRAGLVAHPADYPWSSAAAHLGGSDPWGLLDLDWWREQWPGDSWATYLLANEAANDVATLRHHTKTGRPLGDAEFLAWVEQTTGRRLPGRAR